jgi:predicted outer membrane repeat protein
LSSRRRRPALDRFRDRPVYLDGNRFTLALGGTLIEGNHANEGGGAIFFVSNDRTFFLGARDPRVRYSIIR